MPLLWRFLLRLIPAGLPLSKHDRGEMIKRTASEWMRHSPTGRAMLIGYLVVTVSAMLAAPLYSSSIPLRVTMTALVIFVILWLATLVIVMLNRSYPQHLYAELRARGHNVCPKCGYLRTGLEDAAPCPECGVSIEVPR